MTNATATANDLNIVAVAESSDVAVRPVWRHGLVAALAATALTTSIAAIAKAADVSFMDRDGNTIPVAGFAQFTLVFALVGMAIAAAFARRTRHPRSTFIRTTGVLLALSVVPDFAFGFDGASVAVLVVSHLVAAAIVVPTLASRLVSTR